MSRLKVFRSKIPCESVFADLSPFEHADSFVCKVKTSLRINPDEVMIAFWTSMPGWINLLFKLRNILVKPFGLQTGSDWDYKSLSDAVRNSGQYMFMSVADKTANETIILLDDKHLQAYLSVYVSAENTYQSVFFSTGVNFHNNLGRFYFFCIRPFHFIVVKHLAKRALRSTSLFFDN